MTESSLRLIHIDPGDPFVSEETMKAGEYRLRRIDVVEQWYTKDEISAKMLAAARQFAADFDAAGLQDRFSAQCFDRIDSSPTGGEPERVLMAKDRIRQAMYIVGQIGGSILWDVVGNGDSISEYVKNHAWSGSNRQYAKGALMGALSALVGHYRI